MKTRFSSLDLAAAIFELQSLVGMRVNQIFDVDNKTFLFKLHRNMEKAVLLIESAIRIHQTSFDWPKKSSPSAFTMKLRKHLKNKRIEKIEQLTTDRIAVIQFGSGEVAFHVIIEFFNRGNFILADHTMTIVNVLRPHTEKDSVKFAVREKYSVDRARDSTGPLGSDKLIEILSEKRDTIHKVLIPHLEYGPHLLEHALVSVGLEKTAKFGVDFKESDVEKLVEALKIAEGILHDAATKPSKGYIIKTSEPRQNKEDLVTYHEFHPFLFKQQEDKLYSEYDAFNVAIDDFFSNLEGQKIEIKALQMEREALHKVEKVKENQRQRVDELIAKQEADRIKAELIMFNSELVEEALAAVRSLIASQMSWSAIADMVNEARKEKDPIGLIIKDLKLQINHITLSLSDPYCEPGHQTYSQVDIDLGLSAYANAKLYYNNKKSAAMKEKKTLESQHKAVKSAEKKAKTVLKDIQTMTTISKARKTHWFEKFYWFISSENYLIIGGRDQQQNELIVKRYMSAGDLYVHADIHGASNIIIKNPTGRPVPPKTLNEAGTMAVSYSVGWEAKILCSAWWVHHDQVSKTAPAGEYLQTGSFMIRGQKNYLLPAQLALGFGFMFRVDESCIERHNGERCIKTNEEDYLPTAAEDTIDEELEIEGDDDDADASKLETIQEVEIKGEIERCAEEPGYPEEGSEEVSSSTPTLEPASFPDVEIPKTLPSNLEQLTLESTASRDTDSSTKKDATSSQLPVKDSDLKKTQALKRGQKSKLKKIKEKYKDQDEEEREIRMSILQSAGEKKEPKKSKKNAKIAQKVVNKQKMLPKQSETSDDVEEIVPIPTDLEALNFLTGQPHAEDELLYALPVVAPYNTLQPYKFKLKILPGTTKRGKGAKIAVETFVRSKECTSREKDLIKNVDDQQLARNFPGKVKIYVQKKK